VLSSVSRLDTSSRWGLLPVALVLGVVVALRLGALVLHRGAPRERALFGAIAAAALFAMGVRVLGAFGGLAQDLLFGTLFVLATVLFLVRRDRHLGLRPRLLVSAETAPVVALATGALAVVSLSAYFIPVWQWDALGYHLPFVNFALQRGSLADVPPDVPYISTYPHVVEHLFIAWRAMLPDDRLVDAAQIPFGLLGAGAIAVASRTLGARNDHALAAGLSWMTLPAAFLQLPTNYIDVASAAFLLAAAAFALAPAEPRNVLATAVALGLFLGSKPNAPVATTLVLALVTVRGWAAGRRLSLVAAAMCVVAIGGESYLVNLVRHGNPIWPVRLVVGPISLPGTLPMSALLDSGAAAPRLHGPLPLRVVRSWLTLDAPPVFDMRFGGLGLVYLAALPVAVFTAVRRRWIALGVLAAAALASPDPAVPRYILAFPGLVLAAAATRMADLGPRVRQAVFAASAVAGCFGLVRAYPALAGEGPTLPEYLRLSEDERLRAVGADGSPARFYDALERIGPGDTTAFDASFDLPYLAWPADLSRHASRIPDGAGADETERILADKRIRLFVVDDKSPLATAARARTNEFSELFHCKSSSCIVLLRN